VEVKRNKARVAVIKKTGGNLIWGSINKTTFGTYWFRLQSNTNCLLSVVRATGQVTRLYRSCLGVRSAAVIQAAVSPSTSKPFKHISQILHCDYFTLFFATLRVLRAAAGRKEACFLYVAESY
jgi:hypothetical protein